MFWYRFKSKIMHFFSDIRVYWLGIILFGDSSYHFKGHHMREVLGVLKPGDVFVRRYSHFLGSVLIPGYFSHAAIYVGNDTVIHMLGSGILKEDILTFLRCDDLCVLRCSNSDVIPFAIEKAFKYLNEEIEYDYDFNNTCKKRLYCTELVADCFKYPIVSNEFIFPDDFIKSSYFNVVWESKYAKKQVN